MENLKIETGINTLKFKSRRNSFQISRLFMHLIMIAFCLTCVLPLALIAVISITPEMSILKQGYTFLPSEITFDAYKYIFNEPEQILRSYFITILVTITGTLLGLWLTATIGYIISRKDYSYRKVTSFFIFFTMLFNGGLTPSYILVAQTLHMKDTLLALIIPGALNAWYVLLMRGFMSGIPSSIIESAKIDGASELKIFNSIIIPVSKPGLATIGLFLALGYWNDWFASLLYIDNNRLVSLQYLLYRIMSNIEYLKNALSNSNLGTTTIDIRNLPSLGARMAMCLLAAGPMLIVFVFFQKYFVKGITLGSIKG